MVLTHATELEKGTNAPSFSLPNLDGSSVSLDNYKGKPVLIVFMCNHCPYVVPKVKELVRIQTDFSDIQVIGINSNDTHEYPEDSPKNMIYFAKEQGINFPYLFDETQDVAKSYGAECTPDPFFFDKEHKLIWQGRISSGGMDIGEPELYDVINEFLENGKITMSEQRSMGCNIKWK